MTQITDHAATASVFSLHLWFPGRRKRGGKDGEAPSAAGRTHQRQLAQDLRPILRLRLETAPHETHSAPLSAAGHRFLPVGRAVCCALPRGQDPGLSRLPPSARAGQQPGSERHAQAAEDTLTGEGQSPADVSSLEENCADEQGPCSQANTYSQSRAQPGILWVSAHV